MGASGGSSKQSAFNKSQSVAGSQSFIDPTQQPFLQSLYGMGMGAANPAATQAAAQQAAGATLPGQQRAFDSTVGLTDPTAQIQAQQASLQAGLGQLFREEINPAIKSNAIAAGGLGGGRQGVAEGVATGQLAQAFTQGLGDITARANQTALGAAGMVPGMAQGIYDMSVNPTMAAFDPLSRLSSILGSPTILQESFARSQSSGGSKGKSAQFGFSLI